MGDTRASFALLALLFTTNYAHSEERARTSSEEAVMVGFGSTSDYLGTGPTFTFELGARRELSGFSVALGARAQYERYASHGTGSCGPGFPLEGPCARGVSAYPYTFDETVATLEVPLSIRLGGRDGTIFPYLGAAPGLAFDRSGIAATNANGTSSYAVSTSGRFTFHGFAGTQFHLGPGGIFFEWGFRVSPVEARADGDSHLTSFLGTLGYRLTL